MKTDRLKQLLWLINDCCPALGIVVILLGKLNTK